MKFKKIMKSFIGNKPFVPEASLLKLFVDLENFSINLLCLLLTVEAMGIIFMSCCLSLDTIIAAV